MADGQHPYVDPQRLTDDEAGLYELVATFEYQGRPMTVEAISEAAGLDRETAAAMLQRLTEQNVLVQDEAGGEPGYTLARKDWSAAPGLRQHFPPGHGSEHQEPAGQMPGTGTSQVPQPGGTGTGRGYVQQARAEQVRAEHLRGEEERAEQAQAELERSEDAGGGPERRHEGDEEHKPPPEPEAGTTAPDHLMAGPAPQGRVQDAPDALIARADSEEERPTRPRFVANTVPGKPDGEVDTRS